MTRKKNILFVILLIGIFFISCQSKKDNKDSTTEPKGCFLQIEDSYHRKVVLEKEPQRIVSLSPGITENIFALGDGHKLVGRSFFCNYPKEVENIEVVGDMLNVNIEKIISLNPDLVIMGSIVSRNVVEMLSNINIPVIVLKEEPVFTGIYGILETLGKVLNRNQEALQLQESIKKEIDSLAYLQNMKQEERPKVYYVVGYGQGGEFTAGGNTYINDIMQLSGANNIATDVKGWAFSRELLFARNPEYIFIRKEDYENFCQTKPYNNLEAVKNHKVFPIESSWIDVQTPRSIEAIKYIANCIYPQSI